MTENEKITNKFTLSLDREVTEDEERRLTAADLFSSGSFANVAAAKPCVVAIRSSSGHTKIVLSTEVPIRFQELAASDRRPPSHASTVQPLRASNARVTDVAPLGYGPWSRSGQPSPTLLEADQMLSDLCEMIAHILEWGHIVYEGFHPH